MVGLLILFGAAIAAAAMLLLHEPGPERTAGGESDQWSRVLLMKRAWSESAEGGRPDQGEKRQAWVDAVAEFAEAHPGHARARQVHEELVRDHARDLAGAGRYAESVQLYESLIARGPDDAELRAELAAVVQRQTVNREELQRIATGASPADVEQALGLPPPGWVREIGNVEGWYYPRAEGGAAAVFFADGKVFAVEYEVQGFADPPQPPAAGLREVESP